jgi:hypothetical protein
VKRFAVLLAALVASVAFAHGTPVVVNLEREANTLRAEARTPEGNPVRGMRLEVNASRPSVQRRLTLSEQLDGSYSAPASALRDGEYRFALTDTTPGFTPVTAAVTANWLEGARFEIVLPPSPPSGPDTMLLVVLTVAPVVLSLAVAGFILLGRPKVAPVQP